MRPAWVASGLGIVIGPLGLSSKERSNRIPKIRQAGRGDEAESGELASCSVSAKVPGDVGAGEDWLMPSSGSTEGLEQPCRLLDPNGLASCVINPRAGGSSPERPPRGSGTPSQAHLPPGQMSLADRHDAGVGLGVPFCAAPERRWRPGRYDVQVRFGSLYSVPVKRQDEGVVGVCCWGGDRALSPIHRPAPRQPAGVLESFSAQLPYRVGLRGL